MYNQQEGTTRMDHLINAIMQNVGELANGLMQHTRNPQQHLAGREEFERDVRSTLETFANWADFIEPELRTPAKPKKRNPEFRKLPYKKALKFTQQRQITMKQAADEAKRVPETEKETLFQGLVRFLDSLKNFQDRMPPHDDEKQAL